MSLREEVRCLERLEGGKEMGETMQLYAVFQRKGKSTRKHSIE